MIRAGLNLALLLTSAPALAWTHTEFVWLPEDFPVPYYVADDGTAPNTVERCEASGGIEGCCDEGVPAGYCATATQEGFEAWHAAPCAEFSTRYEGTVANLPYTAADNLFTITFNDPGDVNAPGTAGVTYSFGNETAFLLDGVLYTRFSSTDIVMSANVPFVSNDDVLEGRCSGGSNIRETLTHEIGHALGMGHPCGDDPNNPGSGADCPDPVMAEATMAGTGSACSTRRIDINEDDIEGFNALYGPFATFACSNTLAGEDVAIGVVPFDLNCVVVSESLTEVVPEMTEWQFGDGQSATGLTATNTYTEPGNYTIQLTVHGEREQCGPDGWTNTYRKVGYVRACGEPVPAFEVAHVDGLQYQMLNDSDVSVYGCLSNIEWEAYAGTDVSGEPVLSGITAWEPILEFPEAGTYTVIMNLGGIGGTAAAKVTFEAVNTRGVGRGCEIGATGGLTAGALLIAGGALVARRRRGAGSGR